MKHSVRDIPTYMIWRMTRQEKCSTCGEMIEVGNADHSCPIEVDGVTTDAISLIDRIIKLPDEEIEEHARIYERRAESVPDARNNVSARIAMALRFYLNEKPQRQK